MAAAINDSTVPVVVSAPSYAHGVVDPVTEIAAAVRRAAGTVGAALHVHGRGRHLDLGRPAQVRLHPRAPASCCTASSELRRPQFFASATWPGYTMLNSTMQSTKSGGPLAGAWAVVSTSVTPGYLDLAREVLEAVDRLIEGVAKVPAPRVVVPPESTLVAFATDESCDAFTVTDELVARGWYVQPQLSFAGQPRARSPSTRGSWS